MPLKDLIVGAAAVLFGNSASGQPTAAEAHNIKLQDVLTLQEAAMQMKDMHQIFIAIEDLRIAAGLRPPISAASEKNMDEKGTKISAYLQMASNISDTHKKFAAAKFIDLEIFKGIAVAVTAEFSSVFMACPAQSILAEELRKTSFSGKVDQLQSSLVDAMEKAWTMSGKLSTLIGKSHGIQGLEVTTSTPNVAPK